MTGSVAPDILADAPLAIAGRTFRSRLMVGTGKYRSNGEMVGAIEASGAEIVTVAVRRVDLDRTREEGMLYHLSPDQYFLLANTAGCYTADEAVRYARLAREAGFNDFVKLEVIGDRETLLPDTEGLLAASRTLVREGFQVLAYTNDDLITALRLEDAGCAAVMPLASPIGSGLGLVNPFGIRTIKRRLTVPVIVDAGVGTASDACVTMEQGVDGILMNTALAEAQDSDGHGAGYGPRRRGRPPGVSGGPDAEARDRGAVEPGARDAGVDRCPTSRVFTTEAQRTRRHPPAMRAQGMESRRAAYDVLAQVRAGRPFDAALDQAVKRLGDADRRLAHELAAGVLRGQSALDARLAPLVPRGWASVAPELKEVLRLGAFQLTALDRVPAHAAVDTSVALAKETGGVRAGGFVNAVLRRLDGARAPSEADRGRAHCPGACPGRIRTPPGWWSAGSSDSVSARPARCFGGTTPGRASYSSRPARDRKTLARRWRDAGIAVEPAPFGAGLVTDRSRPRSCRGTAKAPSSCRIPAQALLAWFADVAPEATVYDACAAPGREGHQPRPRRGAGGGGRREPGPGPPPRRESAARRQRARAPDRRGRAPPADSDGRGRAGGRALPGHRHLRPAPGRALAGDARGARHARAPSRASCSTAPPARWAREGC